MKTAFILFALSVLVSAPAFSSPIVMTPEEDAKDAIATNKEVDELFSLSEEDVVETGSTVENSIAPETRPADTTL